MMKMTEDDLIGVNKYGLPYIIDIYGEMHIDTKKAIFCVQKMPYYFDRGRYAVMVDMKPKFITEQSFDEADCFPRYFFKLENLFSEIHELIEIRKLMESTDGKEEQIDREF